MVLLLVSKLYICKLTVDGGLIESIDAINNLYYNDFYGELFGDILKLLSVEVLYLEQKGVLTVVNGKDLTLSFENLINFYKKYDEAIWERYSLYLDLKQRGYIVKGGFSDRLEFRVYKRGASPLHDPASFIVIGVLEGKPLSLEELDKIARQTRISNKELILAVIDREGGITYYEAGLITL